METQMKRMRMKKERVMWIWEVGVVHVGVAVVAAGDDMIDELMMMTIMAKQKTKEGT